MNNHHSSRRFVGKLNICALHHSFPDLKLHYCTLIGLWWRWFITFTYWLAAFPSIMCMYVAHKLCSRLSTAGLLVILCMLYQETYVIFLGLLILDIFSHWCHMYYSLTSGSESHKVTFQKDSRLVWLHITICHHCASGRKRRHLQAKHWLWFM